MKPAVGVIWAATLAAAVVGVVPVTVGLLSRALTAAQNIERYTAEIQASAAGIARNTANTAALKATIAAAPQLVARAEGIEQHAAAIESALSGQPSTNGPAREGTS